MSEPSKEPRAHGKGKDAMTRMVEAPPGTRVLVMADGYRVWPDEYGYADDRSYLIRNSEGVGENGERVTVNGYCVARVEPARVMPVERRRPRGGLMRFERG